MARIVATLFYVAAADSLDEQSMLQMPEVKKAGDQLEADCACPGFFEDDCHANAFQGCVWSQFNIGAHPLGWTDEGMNSRTEEETTGPWCQCDPNFVKTGPLFQLWGRMRPGGDDGLVKCNNNVDMIYVEDQMACQNHARANNHRYYSFRHNGETEGHKCMSSATCDNHLDDRANEWYIYVDPSN